MKKITFFTMLAVVAISIFTSCKKDGSVTSGSTSYAYKLKVSNPTNALARVEGGSIVWTAGTANANLLKFEAKNTTGTEVEFKSNVAQSINLFSTLPSTFGSISLTSGTYSEIEFKAQLVANGSSPSLELTGSYTSNNITTPVSFVVTDTYLFKTEANNITVNANTNYSALANINLTSLTNGITEAKLNAATRTNGKVIISATSNSNLYNTMLQNLDSCDDVHFEKD